MTSASLPREPYHLAKRHEREAAEIVAAATEEARTLAGEAIAETASEAAARGYEVIACGVITGRGRADFTLEQALSTHAGMHNAEGWLFREAVSRAAEQAGLHVSAVTADAAYTQASEAAGVPEEDAEANISELGAMVGPPWTKDQKLASAAAWVALARSAHRAS